MRLHDNIIYTLCVVPLYRSAIPGKVAMDKLLPGITQLNTDLAERIRDGTFETLLILDIDQFHQLKTRWQHLVSHTSQLFFLVRDMDSFAHRLNVKGQTFGQLSRDGCTR